ncbi:hypothetical protein RyT2_14240 [Pseudolactococcus yaeyamensis]
MSLFSQVFKQVEKKAQKNQKYILFFPKLLKVFQNTTTLYKTMSVAGIEPTPRIFLENPQLP